MGTGGVLLESSGALSTKLTIRSSVDPLRVGGSGSNQLQSSSTRWTTFQGRVANTELVESSRDGPALGPHLTRAALDASKTEEEQKRR